MTDGILAPHDQAAERFVLGYAMLLGLDPLDGLLPKHFFFDANILIFQALRDGADGPHGVASALKAMSGDGSLEHWGKLIRVGGGGYLAEIVLDVESVASQGKEALGLHAAACSASVVEHWKKRVIRSAALELSVRLCENLSSADAWSAFRETCRATVG